MTDETRGRQWRAMARESIAVLAAILVAFSLDAWWGNRVERTDALEALASLTTEIEQSLTALDSTVAEDEYAIRSVRNLVMYGVEGVREASDSLLLADYLGLGSYLTLQGRTGAVEALIENGLLGGIRDAELRTQISGLPQAWEEVNEDAQLSSRLWVESGRLMVQVASPELLLRVADGEQGLAREFLLRVANSDEYLDQATTAALFTQIYVAELEVLRGNLEQLLGAIEAEVTR